MQDDKNNNTQAKVVQPVAQHFNQKKVRRAFDQAAEHYEEFAVLQNEVCQRLLDKLDIVKISPQYILDAGTGTGSAIPQLFKKYKKAQLVALDLSEQMLKQAGSHGSIFRSPHLVCADIENLPFVDNVFDLVFSSLSMQWCNDLGAALREAKRVLKPGGLFVFTTFGPDTLKELRQSWEKVNNENHVNQFIDMHDIGDALLHDGFAEPVMEAEIITITYDTVERLMHDLKAIGANITSDSVEKENAGLGGKKAMQKMREAYETYRKDNVLPASYEIIYGHAWKPVEKSKGGQQFVEFTGK